MKSNTHIPIIQTIPIKVKGIPIKLYIFLGNVTVCGISKVTPTNKNQWAKSIGSWLYTKSFPLANINCPIKIKTSPTIKSILFAFLTFLSAIDFIFLKCATTSGTNGDRATRSPVKIRGHRPSRWEGALLPRLVIFALLVNGHEKRTTKGHEKRTTPNC